MNLAYISRKTFYFWEIKIPPVLHQTVGATCFPHMNHSGVQKMSCTAAWRMSALEETFNRFLKEEARRCKEDAKQDMNGVDSNAM